MEQNTKIEPIKLTDCTELLPFDAETKAQLEQELGAVLTKYSAIYLPVIKESKTLTGNSQEATLWLLKKSAVVSPYNGESTDTTKETPETEA